VWLGPAAAVLAVVVIVVAVVTAPERRTGKSALTRDGAGLSDATSN
jgi:hypothetical protein